MWLLISYLQGCDKWVPIETKDLTISRVSRFGQAMFTHDRLVFPLLYWYKWMYLAIHELWDLKLCVPNKGTTSKLNISKLTDCDRLSRGNSVLIFGPYFWVGLITSLSIKLFLLKTLKILKNSQVRTSTKYAPKSKQNFSYSHLHFDHENVNYAIAVVLASLLGMLAEFQNS